MVDAVAFFDRTRGYCGILPFRALPVSVQCIVSNNARKNFVEETKLYVDSECDLVSEDEAIAIHYLTMRHKPSIDGNIYDVYNILSTALKDIDECIKWILSYNGHNCVGASFNSNEHRDSVLFDAFERITEQTSTLGKLFDIHCAKLPVVTTVVGTLIYEEY